MPPENRDFTDDIDRILEESGYPAVQEQLRQLNNDVAEVVESNVTNDVTEAEKQSFLQSVRARIDEADQAVRQWLQEAIGITYVDAVQRVDEQLKNAGIDVDNTIDDINVLSRAPEGLAQHKRAANAMMSDAYLDFGNGLNNVARSAESAFNTSLKAQIRERIRSGILDGRTNREIADEVVGQLKNRGFTALVDKGGRRWALQNYSDMLTRTHIVRANTEATINRSLEYGNDIVQVSEHSTASGPTMDALCLNQEGQIYSLTGQSEKYPQIEILTPFHPNCGHVLMPRPDLQESNR